MSAHSQFLTYISTNLQSPKTLKEIKKDFENVTDEDIDKLVESFVACDKLKEKFLYSINTTVYIGSTAAIDPPDTYKFNSPFKLPVHGKSQNPAGKSASNGQSLLITSASVQKEIDNLKSKLTETSKAISLLSEDYNKDELDIHITKLHEYNEIKDTGQMVLGRIAEAKGVTTQTLYEQFGLMLND